MPYRTMSVRTVARDGDRADDWRSNGALRPSVRDLTMAEVRSSASAALLPARISLPLLRRHPAAPQSRATPVS